MPFYFVWASALILWVGVVLTQNISEPFLNDTDFLAWSDLFFNTSYNDTGNDSRSDGLFNSTEDYFLPHYNVSLYNISSENTTAVYNGSTELPSGKIDENEIIPEDTTFLDEQTLCNTSTGFLHGQIITAGNGKQVIQYLGVPYAEPPVGELRFRRPVAKSRWEGMHEARTLPSSCMQLIDTYLGDFAGAAMWNPNTPLSEDCLYLNIWTPAPKPTNAPVMVWIHGGGFSSGTSTLDIYNGAILAGEESVIVISIQYRLGPFGFYFAGTDDAPGNQGLYDQAMALQWIQENVYHFGGHPKYVTLFGLGSGAASVGLHLLSPVSSPLFMQAILQSGSPTAHWASVSADLALNRSAEFAHRLDCPPEPSSATMACMRAISGQLLLEESPTTGNAFEYYFNPVIDGVFLPKSPMELLKNGSFKRTNLLLGSTSNEGSFFLMHAFPETFQLYGDVHLKPSDFMNAVFKMFQNISTPAFQALVFQYTNWANPNESQSLIDNVEKMIGDRSVTCDINDLAALYSAAGSGVFAYEFDHRTSSSPWPSWMGSQHGQEIEYIFGRPMDSRYVFPETEKQLAKKVMTYWVNFARTGNPSLSSKGEFEKDFWPVHTVNGKEYLRISVENEGTRHGLRARPCAFWKSYLPSLVKTVEEMETAIKAAKSFCVDETRDREDKKDDEPDLLEVEDEWAMEFADWKKDHSVWKKEFNKYVDTLETARKLVINEIL